MGFNCLKDTKPLRGNSSFVTFSFSGEPGIHFINLKKMKAKSTLEPLTGFEPRNP